ncbi:MAG: TetR/AcrR family transcriptional regulator, partial [Acetivibrio sp.]
MGKLDHNKQQKKDALFNTAFELFTTKGINKTTISDIVQKAGVAKGTFYLYFTDKYDVKNKLISKKAGDLFIKGERELRKTCIAGLEPSLIFIVDYIINQLQ